MKLHFLPIHGRRLSPQIVARVCAFYAALGEMDGRFGVVSAEGIPVAIARGQRSCALERLRETVGEEAWERCTMPDLRLAEALEPDVVVWWQERLASLLRGGQDPRTTIPNSDARRMTDARGSRRWQRVQAFLAAVAGPIVEDAEFQRRLTTCQSNRCGHLRIEPGGRRPAAGEEESETRNSDAVTSGLPPPASRLYCGACGCPKWRLAELHTKLRFAHLECPADPPMW